MCVTRLFGQIGFAANAPESWGDQWWWGAYNSAAAKKIGVVSDSGSGSDSGSDSDSDSEAKGLGSRRDATLPPTDEEQFKACGGRRLGLRARARQAGKWSRTEHAGSVAKTTPGTRPLPLLRVAVVDSCRVVVVVVVSGW